MNRDEARQIIRQRVDCKDYLEKSKGGMYCCPFCGSGTGPHGTGALKLYGETNTWTCHACRKSGDVIDLYMARTGADFPTALSLLAQECGIAIDRYGQKPAQEHAQRHTSAFSSAPAQGMPQAPKSEQGPSEGLTGGVANYRAYYQECTKRLSDPAAAAYLERRGISLKTAADYMLGYDPAWVSPTALARGKHPYPSPRIIIPTTASHYIARDTRPDVKDYAKMNEGTPGIFNEAALYAPDVREVFITEGAFDALSLLEIGWPAIALNSASNAEILLQKLERKRTKATLILCLDSDQAGEKAAETIKNGLERMNFGYITEDVCCGKKDPNDALTENRLEFMEAANQAVLRASKPDNTANYVDNLMSAEIAMFKADVKTGFPLLDKETGGLYSGLYVLAAISSLGKTSFALQLADQIAGAGHDVIFFSLEQSRLELVSKSIARRTAQNDMENAVTSLSIRKGYLPPRVTNAAQQYREMVGDRLSIVEGNFNCTTSFIGDYVRRYIQRNNVRPVIFIDYLQILQPETDERGRQQSVKEMVDSTVTGMKRLSREMGLTVFVISSVNRANYWTQIDFDSLKESGGIEYSADVIWGLQLQVMNEEIFEGDPKTKANEKRKKVKEAKSATPREIELCCLKNRYGKSRFSTFYEYYPANDLFIERSEAEIDFQSAATRKPGRKL